MKSLINNSKLGFAKIGFIIFLKKNLEINAFFWELFISGNFFCIKTFIILQKHFIEYGIISKSFLRINMNLSMNSFIK